MKVSDQHPECKEKNLRTQKTQIILHAYLERFMHKGKSPIMTDADYLACIKERIRS